MHLYKVQSNYFEQKIILNDKLVPGSFFRVCVFFSLDQTSYELF